LSNNSTLRVIRYVHCVNHPDDGGVDGRVGAADGGHGGETFRGEQDAVADARAHGVEREDGITAVCAVKMQRLDDEDLAPFMGRDLLRRDDISDDAPD